MRKPLKTQWRRGTRGGFRLAAKRQRARCCKFGVEPLEDRCVLSAGFIYGVDDNNNIQEIDTATQRATQVYTNSPSGTIPAGTSNAFAFDSVRGQFFFIDSGNNLRFWGRAGDPTVLATAAQLGNPLPQPSNAAYYNDAFWFFEDGSNALKKVSFTYSGGLPAFARLDTYILSQSGGSWTNTFGDIAIDANSGVLYGATQGGAFFRVDLNGTPTTSTFIASGNPSLQLSFGSDYGTLYAQNFVGGQWGVVNTTTGAFTSTPGFILTFGGGGGLRDLGGAAAVPATADLVIDKTDNQLTAIPGTSITYTVVVTNNGPARVTGATVTDILPAAITSASWSAVYSSGSSGATSGAGSIAGVSVNLLSAGTATFTVTGIIASSATGTLTSTATVAAPSGVVDPTPSNNSATDTTLLVPTADLLISKTDSRSNVWAGDGNIHTCVITVTNIGPSAATDVVVLDANWPAGFVQGGVAAPAGTRFTPTGNGNFAWTFQSPLAAGESQSLSVPYTVPFGAATGPRQNTASVTSPTVPTRRESTDVTNVISNALAAASDLGCDSSPMVYVINPYGGTPAVAGVNIGVSNEVFARFNAYPELGKFRGGVRVAVGDVDGDGVLEVVTAPGPGAVGRVKVFNLDGTPKSGFASYLPFGMAYRDGVEIGVGDIDGDGDSDLVVAKSRGPGEVQVAKSSGSAFASFRSFTAFGNTYRGGASVAIGGRNANDNTVTIVVSSGAGMAPTVKNYTLNATSAALSLSSQFNPAMPAGTAGVAVTTQRFAGGSYGTLAAAGRNGNSNVSSHQAGTNTSIMNYRTFSAPAPKSNSPVYAAASSLANPSGASDTVFMVQGDGGVGTIRKVNSGTGAVNLPFNPLYLNTPIRSPLRIAISATVDTTVAPPGVALTIDSGTPGDRITNNGALTVTGVEAGAAVQYSTNGGTTWGGIFTPTEGPNTVLVRQVDVAGNVSAATSFSFTLDTVVQAPVIIGFSDDTDILGDGKTSDTDLLIFGSAEPFSTVTLAGVGSAALTTIAAADGTWSIQTGDMGYGNRVFTATATDVAGNASAESSVLAVSIIVDLTALAPAQGFIIQGDAAGDQAGVSVASAGDVNGDGFDDLFVGARFGDDGGRNAGEGYVIFGTASGFGTVDATGRRVIDLTTLTPSQGFIIQGDFTNDWAGRVAPAGDVNGDGFDDMLIGAPLGDDAGIWDAGEAYVVFGSGSGFGTVDATGRRVVDLTTLTAAQGFIIQADKAGDQAGWFVSSAGDVNGDGLDDVLVGAPRGDDGGSDAGEGYVVFGSASGFGSPVTVGGFTRQVINLKTLTAAQGFIIQGDAAGDLLGNDVSPAGDINGDGFDDLIVGAHLGDDGGADAGEAYVIFGSGSGFGMPVTVGGFTRQVINLRTLTAAQGFIIQGDEAGDSAGRVASAGDINGDGLADIIVGASGGDDGGPDAGEAYVIFGSSSGFGTVDSTGRRVIDLTTLAPSQGFVIQGDAAGDGAGASVYAAGDFNGDGFDDLIVGAPGSDDGGIDAGEAYVIFGSASGFGIVNGTGRRVLDLSTLVATQGFTIQGDSAGDLAGGSVAAAGDVNGDGFDDLIVGANGGDDGGADAGEAYVIFGRA